MARPATSIAALGLDDPADVVDVGLAEVGDHLLLDGVELAAELLELGRRECNRMCHWINSLVKDVG